MAKKFKGYIMINKKVIRLVITGVIMLSNTFVAKSQSPINTKNKEYGVYFKIPTGKVKDFALQIAQEHGSTIIPHISVLQAVFNERTVSQVQDILKHWSKNQKSFNVIFKKQIERGGGGNTFWNVKDLEKLNNINAELTRQIDPLRDGFLDQIKKNMPHFTKEELRFIEKYGRHFNVPGSNQPHITVAYGVQDNNLITNSSKKLNDVIMEQEISEVSFGEIDNQGNIVETLYTYRFGK